MIAVYIRVSSHSQSLESQRAEVTKWLEGQGITAQWYEDKASGKDLDRPDFERLQKDIFVGEIKTVVIYKLDRLSRNMVDGINTLTNWLEKGVRVVSVTQQFDFSGAVGKLIAAVLLAVAEMERDSIRERQAAGIEIAKEAKVYTGRKRGSTKAKPGRARALRKQGLTIPEIATAIGVSERTAARYVADQPIPEPE